MNMTLREFEQEQVVGDLLAERIDEEAQELLRGAYKPSLPGNVHEALCNLTTKQFELIGKAMDEKRWLDIGAMVNLWVRAYHEADAYDVAEYSVTREC
ncbi:MAG: hypothetical protein ACYC4K_10870 [Thiobacillus sp.]